MLGKYESGSNTQAGRIMMGKRDKERGDRFDPGPSDSELKWTFDAGPHIEPEWTRAERLLADAPGWSAEPPGPWATFARNALHDVTCGWDERVGALGQSALRELSQLADVITGRKSWSEAGEEALRVNRDALASAQRSREAGDRAHPVAALAGGLVPQLALGVMTGGLLATPLAQGALAASKSLAESPEDLTTIKGLKIAMPRAGIAGGTAAALTKGGQIVRRAISPIAEYLAPKSFGRLLLARVRHMTRGGKDLTRGIVRSPGNCSTVMGYRVR